MPTQGIPIKFLVLNGQRPLTLDFNTFCSSIGLDYKNGKYVAPPTPEVVKKELSKIAINESYVLSGNYSSTEQGLELLESLSQKSEKPLSKRHPRKTNGQQPPTKQRRVLRKSQSVSSSTVLSPKSESKTDNFVGNGISFTLPADKGLPSTASNEGTAKTTPRLEGELRDKDSEGNKPPADMEPIHPTVADPFRDWAKHKEAVVSYADIKASVEGYYEENIDYREQTDKLVKATMDSLDKTATDRVNLLNALNGVIETLKAVQHAVKDDPALNKKSLVESLQAAALRQDEHLASWAKSSNSLAWNLGPRMTAVFKGQASTPLSSVPPTTLAIIELPATIKGENDTHADTEEPPSHTEGENVAIEDDKAEEEPTREVALIKSSSKPPLTDPILKIPWQEAGEKFKKAQDAEHQVLKGEHSQIAKRAMELKKKMIQSTFPAFEQSPFESLGRKRKHMELEHKIKVPRLECNKSLLEGVQLVNNMVIEEPEYGIFFTNVFSDQAFYDVNAMFSHEARMWICETPDQEIVKIKERYGGSLSEQSLSELPSGCSA
ncbi:hypothetical protein Tco_0882885 [Tanacetum coccineum]